MPSESANPEQLPGGSGRARKKFTLRMFFAMLVLSMPACPVLARDRIAGPAIDLPPAYAQNSRVNLIALKTRFIAASPDFDGSFHWQVGAHLQQCARGKRRLKLRVRIDEMDKADLVGRVFRRGTHSMAGALEFISRDAGKVVGRYYFDIVTVSGGPIRALVAEPEFLLSDAFGRYLCQEVFQ